VCARASIMGLGEISVSETPPPRCCLVLISAFGDDYDALASKSAPSRIMRVKTNDEALIGMTYRAIRYGPPDVVARIEEGEVVDPKSYYFRLNPLFETANARYDWLNRVIAIGIGHRLADGPIYSIFEVL